MIPRHNDSPSSINLTNWSGSETGPPPVTEVCHGNSLLTHTKMYINVNINNVTSRKKNHIRNNLLTYSREQSP
jgi:hypothetical protein